MEMLSFTLLFCRLQLRSPSLLSKGILGKCPPDDSSEASTYSFIPEDQYDRNYSSISAIDAHPLGFYKAVWPHDSPDDHPCVRVTGASNRRIEIMIETDPVARLCVKEENSDAACADAGTGRHYSCQSSLSDELFFEFFCNQGEETDVQFWYRFVLGDLPVDDSEDHWCDDRITYDYPSSLLQLPADFPLNQVTTAQPDAGQNLKAQYFLTFCIVSMLLMMGPWF